VSFEVLPVYAMGLPLPMGDVIVHVRTKLTEGFYEKSRGRLPIYVKVAPDQNSLSLLDGRPDSFGAVLQVWKILGRRRIVGRRVQKRPRVINRPDPALGQEPRHEGITPDEVFEPIRDRRGRRSGPFCHVCGIGFWEDAYERSGRASLKLDFLYLVQVRLR
jgi:hypothetical protein